jgi:hypothetical protein
VVVEENALAAKTSLFSDAGGRPDKLPSPTWRSSVEKVPKVVRDRSARSLEEGFEETLTIHRLGVPADLRKTLRSTNPIENCFSFKQKYCRNVKRWSSAGMVLRWSSAMLLEVEKRFRKIRGHRGMPQLLAALYTVSMDKKKATA